MMTKLITNGLKQIETLTMQICIDFHKNDQKNVADESYNFFSKKPVGLIFQQ